MKKFVFGVLSVLILMGGALLTACGNQVSLSVSTQDVVIYTNDDTEENSGSKEIEVSLDGSSFGIGVDVLQGEDCIDIEQTYTTKAKANGKFAFVIKAKENNKNSGFAKVNVWSIEDKSKSVIVNVTVNTILEELTALSDESADSKSNLYAVKGQVRSLECEEFFSFYPITANVRDVVWTFEENGTDTYEVDGKVLAYIDGSELYVSEDWTLPSVRITATPVQYVNGAETVELSVIDRATIQSLIVDGQKFYDKGAPSIVVSTTRLTRNDSEASSVSGSIVVNSTYDVDLSLLVYDTRTGEELSKEEYSKYFTFDTTGKTTTDSTTTYVFAIDAIDTTSEKVYGNFLVKFKVSYVDYNYDIVTEDLRYTVSVNYTATGIDVFDGNGNVINNSMVEVFSSYTGTYGYQMRAVVKPEDVVIENNSYRISIDTNQAALNGLLGLSNPIDQLIRFYSRGRYLRFTQAAETSPVYVSDTLVSGTELYAIAMMTVEGVEVNIECAGNNTIYNTVFMNLYQITSSGELTAVVTKDDEEVTDAVYLSSSASSSKELTFEAKVSGVSSLAGLSLASGSRVSGGQYVENDLFDFSGLTLIDSKNDVDEKYVEVRFSVELTSYNFASDVYFWFSHVTGKDSAKYQIKTFIPIEAASIQIAESSSDIYVNSKQNMGFKVEAGELAVDDQNTNVSLAKLMVEAGATISLYTDYKNATLSEGGVEFRYLSYENFAAMYGGEEDVDSVFDEPNLAELVGLFNSFDEVTATDVLKIMSISTDRLIVKDAEFKGFVCILFNGFDEDHNEMTLARLFALESFYSIRYMATDTRTTLLYTVETLSESDIARSYVDVKISLRPDEKTPTYSNIMENLSFVSSGTTLVGSIDTDLRNAYYTVSGIGFTNGGRYINFKITAYSTNMLTSVKDSLSIHYIDGNGREKATEVQI